MTRALVTGAGGWVGGYVAPLLAERGFDVVRTGRTPGADPGYVAADLSDLDSVTRLLDEVRPDVVIHLAAATPQRVPAADRLVEATVGPVSNLAAALRANGGRLVLAGSSAQYGALDPGAAPLTEDCALRPAGAYGWAKCAAEAIARGLSADDRFELVATRPFNHVGPGETAATVAGALARKVAAVAAGSADKVTVRDIDAIRDFTDVRDVARAYADLAAADLGGPTVNICSQRPVAVRAVLETLLQVAGLDWSVVEVLPGAGPVARQVGSARRIGELTAWTAAIPLRRSLEDLYADVARG
ncbi:NAD-dependent epimerase/dehydratase family protein [Hamadaea tsunoensis]|uniref:NAD-dependent epimerase/dehydratase family protein n=1 Tax=Hamadaea tsunoensis TaxID=53368 RepID=UPI0003F57E7E|nr:NAD-dependent epimerase/dehydratase family protein [Hamadaea tsunoensis]